MSPSVSVPMKHKFHMNGRTAQGGPLLPREAPSSFCQDHPASYLHSNRYKFEASLWAIPHASLHLFVLLLGDLALPQVSPLSFLIWQCFYHLQVFKSSPWKSIAIQIPNLQLPSRCWHEPFGLHVQWHNVTQDFQAELFCHLSAAKCIKMQEMGWYPSVSTQPRLKMNPFAIFSQGSVSSCRRLLGTMPSSSFL